MRALKTRAAARILGATALCCLLPAGAATAQETLAGALARAYTNTPELNAQRANLRALDELVPQALSGYRPRITASADIGRTFTESITPGFGSTSTGQRVRTGKVGNSDAFSPRGVGLQVDQTLFNGFRTENSTRSAESQVLGARETLRNVEQNVLLAAATAYMNVLRDTALLNLQRNNVEVLEEQLRQTRDRFRVGEVTRTDVAQAESRLALARSQASAAEGNLRSSIAVYRQRVGVEPRRLSPGQPVENLIPKSIEACDRQCLEESSCDHRFAAWRRCAAAPGEGRRIGALSDGDGHGRSLAAVRSRAERQRIAVGLRRRPSDRADLRRRTGLFPRAPGKETLGERRIQVDQQRDVVRQAVVASWSGLQSAKAQIIASQAQVAAAEIALAGVREEAKVGQRTTLDVLNSQQELLTARSNLVVAQRDRIVASYNVLASTGRLSAQVLALRTQVYNPKVHFDQVRDKWIGTTTPDGR